MTGALGWIRDWIWVLAICSVECETGQGQGGCQARPERGIRARVCLSG